MMPYYHLYRQEQPDEFHQMCRRMLTLTTIESPELNLLQIGFGAINTTDTSTNGFYVILFTSCAYTLQENTTIDGQILLAEELVVNAKYLCSMQVDTNWYWNQQPNNHVITVPTRTILHSKLEVNVITDFHAIPTHVCSRTQAKNPSQGSLYVLRIMTMITY